MSPDDVRRRLKRWSWIPECKTIQRIKEPEGDRNAFSLYASFASPEQMDMLRDAIQAGESLLLLCLIFGWNF